MFRFPIKTPKTRASIRQEDLERPGPVRAAVHQLAPECHGHPRGGGGEVAHAGAIAGAGVWNVHPLALGGFLLLTF